jgi:hypothetical protein
VTVPTTPSSVTATSTARKYPSPVSGADRDAGDDELQQGVQRG